MSGKCPDLKKCLKLLGVKELRHTATKIGTRHIMGGRSSPPLCASIPSYLLFYFFSVVADRTPSSCGRSSLPPQPTP